MNLYEDPALRQVTGETIRPGGLQLTKKAVEYCGFPRGSRVVDVGCGLGATVEYLVRECGLQAVGVDPSRTLLSQARARRPDLTFYEGTAESLPLGTSTVEGIFCECVLSLTPGPKAALGEFHRVLVDRGFLVVSDMYIRDGRSQAISGGCRDSCVSGALGMTDGLGLLLDAGFRPVLWEDHTRLLGKLAAKLIFAGFSLDGLLSSGGEADPDGSARYRASDLGYFLLVAKRV